LIFNNNVYTIWKYYHRGSPCQAMLFRMKILLIVGMSVEALHL